MNNFFELLARICMFFICAFIVVAVIAALAAAPLLGLLFIQIILLTFAGSSKK